MNIRTNFLLFLTCIMVLACSSPQETSNEEITNDFFRASNTSQQLGIDGFTKTISNDRLIINISGNDPELNGQQFIIEEDNEDRLLVHLTTKSNAYYQVDLDRKTQHVRFTFDGKELLVDKEIDDIGILMGEESKMRFAAMGFLMRDSNEAVPATTRIEAISNEESYFCRMTFFHMGGRANATAEVASEVAGYASSNGCTASVIGGIDCGCGWGDLACFCMGTYNMVGEDCECGWSLVSPL